MKVLTYAIFIFCFCSFASDGEEEDFKNRHKIVHLTTKGPAPQSLWSIKFSKYNSLEKIELFKKGKKKPTLTWVAELVTHAFRKGSIVKFNGKRYFVTQWTSGAHSEEVLIFDLNLKEPKPIWSYISAWPAEIKVNKKEVIVLGTGDRDPKTGDPKIQTIRWSPAMKPMDFSLESEASQSSKSE